MGDNFELNNRVDVDQLLSGDIIDEEVVNQVFDDIPVDDMPIFDDMALPPIPPTPTDPDEGVKAEDVEKLEQLRQEAAVSLLDGKKEAMAKEPPANPLSKFSDERIYKSTNVFVARAVKMHHVISKKRNEYYLTKLIMTNALDVGLMFNEVKNKNELDIFIKTIENAIAKMKEIAYYIEILFTANYIDQKEYNSIYGNCITLINMYNSLSFSTM